MKTSKKSKCFRGYFEERYKLFLIGSLYIMLLLYEVTSILLLIFCLNLVFRVVDPKIDSFIEVRSLLTSKGFYIVSCNISKVVIMLSKKCTKLKNSPL